MTRQLLGRLGMNARGHKRGDELVAQRMEVKHAPAVAVRDAGGRQIAAEHVGRLFVPGPGPQPPRCRVGPPLAAHRTGSSRDASRGGTAALATCRQPTPQLGRQIVADGLLGQLFALGVTRLDADHRFAGQLQRRFRQARQLRSAEPGLGAHQVQHRAIGAVEPTEHGASAAAHAPLDRGFNQSHEVGLAEPTAFMADVVAGLHRRQSFKGIFRRSAGAHQPAAERTQRAHVVVAGRFADPADRRFAIEPPRADRFQIVGDRPLARDAADRRPVAAPLLDGAYCHFEMSGNITIAFGRCAFATNGQRRAQLERPGVGPRFVQPMGNPAVVQISQQPERAAVEGGAQPGDRQVDVARRVRSRLQVAAKLGQMFGQRHQRKVVECTPEAGPPAIDFSD